MNPAIYVNISRYLLYQPPPKYIEVDRNSLGYQLGIVTQGDGVYEEYQRQYNESIRESIERLESYHGILP